MRVSKGSHPGINPLGIKFKDSNYHKLAGGTSESGWRPQLPPHDSVIERQWNKPQYAGLALEPTENIQVQLDMSAKLAEEYLARRLYRRDTIADACAGLQPAVANPPAIPKTMELPADLSLADNPLPAPGPMDEIHRQALYFKPFFESTPIVHNNDLYGGFTADSVVA